MNLLNPASTWDSTETLPYDADIRWLMSQRTHHMTVPEDQKWPD